MNKTRKEKILNRLIHTFHDRNETEFMFILERNTIGGDTSLKTQGIQLTIAEYVLQTRNSRNFIKMCLDRSSSLLKRNTDNRNLFHYAVQSLCTENINELINYLRLSQPYKFNEIFFNKIILPGEIHSNNYLHDVVDKLDSENINQCLDILKILLDYGCNPNHLNNDSKSPFEVLLDKIAGDLQHMTKIFEIFKASSLEVDEDYKSCVNNFENVKFRSEIIHGSESFVELIKRGNEDEFLKAFLRGSTESSQEQIRELMKLSMDMNFSKAVSILFEYTKPIATNGKDNESDQLFHNANKILDENPLFYAVSICRNKIVKELLRLNEISFQHYQKNQNILHVICSLKEIESEKDFLKCFYLLIVDKRCTDHIINGIDIDHKTPLMYACENHHKEFQCELLRRNAFVGHKSIINDLHENILSKQLDESLTASSSLMDHNCVVSMDYNFLLPSKYSDSRYQEMETLDLIASQRRMKSLLTHPVLTSFLELKWKRINFLVYGTLLIYFLFFVYLSLFLLKFFNQKICTSNEETIILRSMTFPETTTKEPLRNLDIVKILFGSRRKRNVIDFPNMSNNHCINTSEADYIKENRFSYIVSVLGTFILTILEVIQLIFTWKRYFFKLSNLIDCTFLSLAYVVLLSSFGTPETLRRLRATLFLVIAIQSFILIGRVSKFSIHVEIFKKVCKTFMKFIMLYFMLIFAFAMAFYTIYGQQASNDEGDSFGNIFLSTVTVFRMMLSDFEGIKFKQDDIFNATMFLIFVLLITIILFNLLNALAITDTQYIMKSAEIVDIRKRIRMIRTCEKIFGYLKIDIFNIFSNKIVDGRIYLIINQNNFVQVRKNSDSVTEYHKVTKFHKCTSKNGENLMKYFERFYVMLSQSTIEKIRNQIKLMSDEESSDLP